MGKQTKTSQRSPARPLVAVMSSGFFGFFAHAGFLQALEDLGLEPDAYAGSSSGALVAAFAAAGVSAREMLHGFTRLRREDFWDPPRGASLLRHLLGLFRKRTGYLEGLAFQRLLERDLPAAQFQDCPKPCLVSTLDLVSNQRLILDSGPLARAVVASGAVPMLFSAVPHQGGLLVDGGMVDKAPVLPACSRWKPGALVVHLLPSSSLEKPLPALLARSLAPLRLQARAIDAARQQAYQDQVAQVRAQGVEVREVIAAGLPRLGPKRLQEGPRAFEQARVAARKVLAAWMGLRDTDPGP